jgi:hypothetical protein
LFLCEICYKILGINFSLTYCQLSTANCKEDNNTIARTRAMDAPEQAA